MARKIDLMIVGAPKSGTTSLLQYFAAHPDIATQWQAEFGFFLNDAAYEQGIDKALDRFFKDTSKKNLVAKHAVLMYSQLGIHRLYQHNSTVQVVALLRNPVTRSYSGYWYARKQGADTTSTFEEAIAPELQLPWDSDRAQFPRHYLANSIYVPYIRQLFKQFGREQTHIILTEDLKTDANAVYTRLLHAMGLELAETVNLASRHNKSAQARYPLLARLYNRLFRSQDSLFKKILRPLAPKRLLDQAKKAYVRWNSVEFEPPAIDPQTKARLQAYFEPANRELSELLERDLSFWNQ